MLHISHGFIYSSTANLRVEVWGIEPGHCLTINRIYHVTVRSPGPPWNSSKEVSLRDAHVFFKINKERSR